MRKPNYSTYIMKRNQLISGQGYSLEEAMTESEYIKAFENARARGMKNIARELAYGDQVINRAEARGILDLIEDYKKTDIDAYNKIIKKFPKHANMKQIMSINENLNLKPGTTHKSKRQQLYFDLADELGSQDKADEFFGY